MSALENILGKLPDRVSSGKQEQIFTPPHVAKEMIDALPEDIWNRHTTFLDPICKSGIFLYYIYMKLMGSADLIEAFPDEKERTKHILNKQIFGIAVTKLCQMFTIRAVYGYLAQDNHIILLSDYQTVMRNKDKSSLTETLQKEFGIMEFDVVIGNPPYNKGMDLDFVDAGYKLAKEDTGIVCMITPAKWQTADGEQKVLSNNINYEKFRQLYVPHMKHVCFYPDCLDVFRISQADGISWYIIDKNNTYENNCTVVNKCNLQKNVNSTEVRDITHQQSLWNIGQEIINYIGDYKTYHFEPLYTRKAFTVNMNTQLMQSLTASGAWDWDASCIKPEYVGKGGFLFNQNGQLLVLNKTRVLRGDEKSSVSASKDVFTSDDIEECKSFYSWINSKFVRFFVLINISSLTLLNDNSFRFVPAPPSGKFDHIYTDEELYKAFKLPQKYIDVIEETIKERK